MSKEWYLIDHPYYMEGSETEDFAFDSEYSFEDLLEYGFQIDNVLFCRGTFDGTNFEEEVSSKAIIQNETPDTSTQAWQRQILTKIGSLADYKYIKYKGNIWLILTEPSDNLVYEKAILYWCNYTIKWQDNKGTIHHKPCNIQNASQYNSGIDETKQIRIGYDQIMMYISLDEETKYFPRDKRFFVDYNTKEPTPFKITRPDTVSYSFSKDRAMHIVLTEDQLNPQRDNVDLMLCDYFTPAETTEPVAITYAGNAEIRCGGTAKTFTADTESKVEWSLKTLDIQDGYITLTADNNKVKLKCANQKSLIGSSFKLICKVDDSTSELLIKIVGGV